MQKPKIGRPEDHNRLTAVLLGLHLLFLLRCELAVFDPAPSVLHGVLRPLQEPLSGQSLGAVTHVQLLVFHETQKRLVLRERPIDPHTTLLLGLDDFNLCNREQARSESVQAGPGVKTG